jgi:hypothetical protein
VRPALPDVKRQYNYIDDPEEPNICSAILWLCVDCHPELHPEFRQQQRREADRIAQQRLRERQLKPKPTKVCPVCGTTFTPQRSDAVVCCSKCRKKQSRAVKAGS